MNMLIDCYLAIPREAETVSASTSSNGSSVSQQSGTILVGHLSGNCLRVEEFSRSFKYYPAILAGRHRENSAEHIFKDGNVSAILGMSIPFQDL